MIQLYDDITAHPRPLEAPLPYYPLPFGTVSSQQAPMSSRQNIHSLRNGTKDVHRQYYGYGTPLAYGQTNTYPPSFAALINQLPEDLLLRILSFCDEVTLLDLALTSRRWLVHARRAFFSSYTIEASASFRLLLLFLQYPGSSVRPEYITHLDVSFTSDESSSPANYYDGGRGRPTSHVSISDIHQLMLLLPAVESLRADWVGSRSAPPPFASSPSRAGPTTQYPVPAFLQLQHISYRLQHLEVRGGSWQLGSLLLMLVCMPRLRTFTMENVHESTTSHGLPLVAPPFHLSRLSLGRCTLSGETISWMISSSQTSLRHLTLNSVRRRTGGGPFSSAFSLVGSSLETLRVRNYGELKRWDLDSFVQSGLGYCSNLRSLVVWSDHSQASPLGGSTRGAQSDLFMIAGPMSPSVSGFSPSVSPVSRQVPRLASSPMRYPLGHAYEPMMDPMIAPGRSSTPSYTLAHSPTGTLPPSSGSMLPLVVGILRQGWLPRLSRLVIPSWQADACPNRAECEAELLIRGVMLSYDWNAV
ncbi:hypothetical protein FRC19_008246 [Serendipita sp. 401]|nr:hypothetical protein FRC19_008246 [Serendipita sp. 401]